MCDWEMANSLWLSVWEWNLGRSHLPMFIFHFFSVSIDGSAFGKNTDILLIRNQFSS